MLVERPTFTAALRYAIKRRLLSGVLVLVPIGITVFALSVVFRLTVGLVIPFLSVLFRDRPPLLVYGLSTVVFIAALYLIGMFANLVVGRKLIALGEWVVQQIPLVKTIYFSSKQVVELFQNQPETGRQQVVLVDFPQPGLKALGFVTGRIRLPDGTECHKVFIPTTPNPTTGFLQLAPVADSPVLDMSADEAIRIIMSGGLLAPPQLAVAQAVEGTPEPRSG